MKTKVEKNRYDRIYAGILLNEFIDSHSNHNRDFDGFISLDKNNETIVIRITPSKKGYLIGNDNEKEKNKLLHKDLSKLVNNCKIKYSFIDLN